MLRLEQAQANFIATINEGPDALDPALFTGPVDRVLLGLKAHANTISHARLVALEETFPLTRQEMGEAQFNLLSRDYVEAVVVRRACSNEIGRYFPDFLQVRAVNTAIIELAAIEWAWLESYHAADAAALSTSELAGLDEDVVVALPVAAHPSLRLVAVTAPLASALGELAGEQPAAIAAIRPNAEVRLLPLDALENVLALQLTEKNCTLGNLIALSLEQTGEQAPLEPILHLIGAGALVKAG
jgi:hypothetical protein